MNDSTIKNLIEQGEEGERLELLRDVNLQTVGRTVTAFLNSDGGKIIIGVGGANKVVGVKNSGNAVARIRKHLSESVFPRDVWTVTAEAVGVKECIVVDVPAGSSLPYSYDDEIFVQRADGQIVAATGRDVSNLTIGKHAGSERWERLPALGSSMKELDKEEINKTISSMADRLMSLPETNDSLSTLENLNLAIYGQILNSAFVLFAKEPQRRYPQIRVRAARFADDERLEFIDNRIIEGNCFALVEQIMGFLRANTPVISTLDEAAYQRSDKPAYPFLALREAVMNALVHRDYSAFDGSVSIAIYPNRFEIWNPGDLPEGMSISDLKTSGISRLRNPDIAHIFFLRGLIERWGIGIKRIYNECLKAELPEPEWEEVGGGIRLTIRLTAQPDKRGEEEAQLNEREIEFLKGIGVGFQIDVKDYLDNYAGDVTERTARRDLSQMVELGYLKMATRGSRKIYTRTDKSVR